MSNNKNNDIFDLLFSNGEKIITALFEIDNNMPHTEKNKMTDTEANQGTNNSEHCKGNKKPSECHSYKNVQSESTDLIYKLIHNKDNESFFILGRLGTGYLALDAEGEQVFLDKDNIKGDNLTDCANEFKELVKKLHKDNAYNDEPEPEKVVEVDINRFLNALVKDLQTGTSIEDIVKKYCN